MAAESIFDDDLLYRSRVDTLFQKEPSFSSATALRRREPGRLLPSLAIAVAFLTVGYVFSEPLYSKGTATSVAQICGRALDRTQAWLHHSDQNEAPAPAVQMAEDDGPQPDASRRGASRIRVTPVRDPFLAGATTPAPVPAQAQPLHVEDPAPKRAAVPSNRPGSHSGESEGAGADRDHAQRGCSNYTIASRRSRAGGVVRGSLAPLAAAESSAQLSRKGGPGTGCRVQSCCRHSSPGTAPFRTLS